MIVKRKKEKLYMLEEENTSYSWVVKVVKFVQRNFFSFYTYRSSTFISLRAGAQSRSIIRITVIILFDLSNRYLSKI